MEVIGLKELRIDQLVLPGDFRKRVKTPAVARLAESMDSVGQLHEPVVRLSDRRLLAGGDRVASHVARGLTVVLCKVVECDDAEAEEIQIVENTHRRHDPERNARELERLLALYSARSARQPDPVDTTPTGQSKPKPVRKREIREKVAKVRGVKPESVRKAEQRARERAQGREKEQRAREQFDAGLPVEPTKVPIQDLGFDVDPDWTAKVDELKALVETAANRAAAALGAMTQIESKGLPFPPAKLQRLRQELQTIAAVLRQSVPRCLCPYCKGQPELLKACTACVQTSWISDAQMNTVPEELWRTDRVFANGRIEALEFDEPPIDGLEGW